MYVWFLFGMGHSCGSLVLHWTLLASEFFCSLKFCAAQEQCISHFCSHWTSVYNSFVCLCGKFLGDIHFFFSHISKFCECFDIYRSRVWFCEASSCCERRRLTGFTKGVHLQFSLMVKIALCDRELKPDTTCLDCSIWTSSGRKSRTVYNMVCW
jgi:hypothetical protein